MREFTLTRLPGLTPYDKARELQLELLARRIRDEIPDTFLGLEHTPVVTRGRGLQRKPGEKEQGIRAMSLGPLPGNVEYRETERGGDLTYHGPGQLVIYPIVKLDGGAPWAPSHDIGLYLRWLERAVAQVFEAEGLETIQKSEATGVWCRRSAQDEFKKIASIGIAARSWVTYHGVAINLANDLELFRWISPCGFNPEVMTSARELGLFSESRVETWVEMFWMRFTSSFPSFSQN